MAEPTTDPAAPAGDPAVGDANVDDPVGDPKDLGDAGKRALDAERRSARAARREADAAKAELEALRKQSMTDAEKAIAAARQEGEQAAIAKANERLLRSEVRIAAAGKLADPSDAVRLIDLAEIRVDDAGEPDAKQIARLVDALIKDKPYLAAGPQPGGSFDGGARQTAPGGDVDMNTLLRRAAGRA